jgi:inner membrane protein
MENSEQKLTFFQSNAALIKGFFIGFLIFLLLIPTFMIQSIVSEREGRKSEVIREVSSKWGNSQQLIGPILRIPYYEISRIEKLLNTTLPRIKKDKTKS